MSEAVLPPPALLMEKSGRLENLCPRRPVHIHILSSRGRCTFSGRGPDRFTPAAGNTPIGLPSDESSPPANTATGNRVEPYGTVWNHVEPYGTVWNRTEPYGMATP